MLVDAKPLSAETFKPFGFVFEAPAAPGRSPPAAELRSHRDWAIATLTVSLEGQAASPHRIARLERHPFSTQTFIPLDLSRYLIVVAPALANGNPSTSEARAFVGAARQGCSYATGLWHAAFSVLDRRGSYAALIWRDGSVDDEVFFDLPEPLTVTGI
jgi:ureidoglycolate lyase